MPDKSKLKVTPHIPFHLKSMLSIQNPCFQVLHYLFVLIETELFIINKNNYALFGH